MILGALALAFALWGWLEAARAREVARDAERRARELEGRFDDLAAVNAGLLESVEDYNRIFTEWLRGKDSNLPH